LGLAVAAQVPREIRELGHHNGGDGEGGPVVAAVDGPGVREQELVARLGGIEKRRSKGRWPRGSAGVAAVISSLSLSPSRSGDGCWHRWRLEARIN
jgi:hypothetical protein